MYLEITIWVLGVLIAIGLVTVYNFSVDRAGNTFKDKFQMSSYIIL